MSIQHWLFSFKGRSGRRDFWIWIGLWIAGMILLFTLTDNNLLNLQIAAFMLVCLMWPTGTVIVKRLHDRNKSGAWGLLIILAWMLLAGNWSWLPGIWQWIIGSFIPTLILIMLLFELGAFIGTQGENKYGKNTDSVCFRRTYQ